LRARVDALEAPKSSPLVPAPVKIKPPGIGVDFHCNPMSGTSFQNSHDIDVVAGQAQLLALTERPEAVDSQHLIEPFENVGGNSR
jgi:hypothetical protein